MPTTLDRPQRQRGITLIEQLVVLGVTALVAGATAPSFSDLLQRQALKGAANLLRTDLHHARSLAVAQARSLRLRVQSDGAGSCYVVHTGGPNDCSCAGLPQPQCIDGAEVFRSAYLPVSERISLKSNSGSMLFDARLGTVTPTGTLELSSQSGRVVRVVVNITGRARQCTTTPPFDQLPTC